MARTQTLFLIAGLISTAACSAPDGGAASLPPVPALPAPLAGVENANAHIEPGEVHFAHLWKVTAGIENAAEGYWSFAGDRLCFQVTRAGKLCDEIFVTPGAGESEPVAISNGLGVTTCSYFMPGDRAVLYSSTHAYQADCPPRVDMSKGYVWPVHPEYDIYAHDLATGRETALTTTWGYDAEATVSPLGDRIVFTSTRSGDLELWTCDLDGGHPFQVTRTIGYDGGAFFSHDGQWLVYRSTAFTPGAEAQEQKTYLELLADWKVRPHSMDITVIRPDGSERRRVTNLGQASFAPYFFPSDQRIIFASNHHDKRQPAREFDLFAIDVDGQNLEKITHYEGFDSFPMFSPDGKWLAFASNRGGSKTGETNLFIAQWRD
ncbi:MAG: hypothetical protein ACKVWV_08145 [Planctomycetota bacterium]